MPKESEHIEEAAVKADGEDSATHGTVTPAGGTAKGKNRKADLNKSVDPKADDNGDDAKTPSADGAKSQAPARKADKRSVKESVDEMFDGQDLSEEFKDKVSVVFESAVNAKLAEEADRLEEEFETRLQEETKQIVSTMEERVDTYLDYVVERWMEDNEVAIDKGIKSEMAESFMNGLVELFAEHNVEVDEEKVDAFASVNEELDETKRRLDEALNENIKLEKQLTEATIEDAFEEISEGLAETQVDKFKSLVEGIEYKDVDDYKRKAKIIKENYFDKPVSEDKEENGVDKVEPLNEEVEETHSNSMVNQYAESISRTLRK